ncbi:MAG: hypothetical protein FWE62_04850, partial [Firmicutes bacterium]|nr:hypothetical protein [Bacillota bacterium]
MDSEVLMKLMSEMSGGGEHNAMMSAMPALMTAMNGGGNAMESMLPALMAMNKGGENNAMASMLPILMANRKDVKGGGNTMASLLPALLAMNKGGGENSAMAAAMPALMAAMTGAGQGGTQTEKIASDHAAGEAAPIYFDSERTLLTRVKIDETNLTRIPAMSTEKEAGEKKKDDETIRLMNMFE